MSKNKLDVDFDKTKNKEYNIPCVNCDGETVHKVLSSVNTSGEEYIEQYFSITYWEDYEIIQCQGCRLITFRKNSTNTEEFVEFQDSDGSLHEKLMDHEELFPSRLLGRKKLRKYTIIPYEVRRIYDETHKALSDNLSILTTIGIRALIEAICKEKYARGRNLQAKIEALKNMGILTEEASNILHNIRLLGNVAAHEVEPPKPDILNAAFEIVESLLSNVYIIPEIAKKLSQT